MVDGWDFFRVSTCFKHQRWCRISRPSTAMSTICTWCLRLTILANMDLRPFGDVQGKPCSMHWEIQTLRRLIFDCVCRLDSYGYESLSINIYIYTYISYIHTHIYIYIIYTSSFRGWRSTYQRCWCQDWLLIHSLRASNANEVIIQKLIHTI